MQLANHATAVEQQHAAMMAQLGEFNQRLQQTTGENEQLAKEISSLRNAVNVSSSTRGLQCKFPTQVNPAGLLRCIAGCQSARLFNPATLTSDA